jgi:hypothetical protein
MPGLGRAVHFRDVVIVELGIVPRRHSNLGQAIDRSRRLPIDYGGRLAVAPDHVPRGGIEMPDDVRCTNLSAEPWANASGFLPGIVGPRRPTFPRRVTLDD